MTDWDLDQAPVYLEKRIKKLKITEDKTPELGPEWDGVDENIAYVNTCDSRFDSSKFELEEAFSLICKTEVDVAKKVKFILDSYGVDLNEYRFYSQSSRINALVMTVPESYTTDYYKYDSKYPNQDMIFQHDLRYDVMNRKLTNSELREVLDTHKSLCDRFEEDKEYDDHIKNASGDAESLVSYMDSKLGIYPSILKNVLNPANCNIVYEFISTFIDALFLDHFEYNWHNFIGFLPKHFGIDSCEDFDFYTSDVHFNETYTFWKKMCEIYDSECQDDSDSSDSEFESDPDSDDEIKIYDYEPVAQGLEVKDDDAPKYETDKTMIIYELVQYEHFLNEGRLRKYVDLKNLSSEVLKWVEDEKMHNIKKLL